MRKSFTYSFTMGLLVKTQLAFLELLATSKRNQAQALILTMTKPQLNAICEVLINIRFGNITVNDNDKKKLQRKKNAIVQLTSKTTGANIRKALMEKEVALILMIIK